MTDLLDAVRMTKKRRISVLKVEIVVLSVIIFIFHVSYFNDTFRNFVFFIGREYAGFLIFLFGIQPVTSIVLALVFAVLAVLLGRAIYKYNNPEKIKPLSTMLEVFKFVRTIEDELSHADTLRYISRDTGTHVWITPLWAIFILQRGMVITDRCDVAHMSVDASFRRIDDSENFFIDTEYRRTNYLKIKLHSGKEYRIKLRNNDSIHALTDIAKRLCITRPNPLYL